jgi:hypothetical protein
MEAGFGKSGLDAIAALGGAAESFDYCLALYLAGVERMLAGKRPLNGEGHFKL